MHRSLRDIDRAATVWARRMQFHLDEVGERREGGNANSGVQSCTSSFYFCLAYTPARFGPSICGNRAKPAPAVTADTDAHQPALPVAIRATAYSSLNTSTTRPTM